MTTVFISYSHKDESLRNELENHLAMLKRDGTIETWHDRRIVAGSDLDGTISENLEVAEVILLLISANFLASDYCYDVEMARALEKQKEGSAAVIPVILKPCDWQSSQFGQLLATPTDAKPVTMFGNQDEAFTIIARDIRRAAEHFNTRKPSLVQAAAPSAMARSTAASSLVPPAERSSNLRIKHNFNDQERDDFLENTYEYMARYFEGSLAELQKRNPQITTKFKRLDANSFTASIYLNGERVTVCSVISGGTGGFGGGNSIHYSSSPDAPRNSWNEQLTVADDGYTLHLQAGFMQGGDKRLTEEGAAELYWSILIQPLQR
jgi:hypothetical protein